MVVKLMLKLSCGMLPVEPEVLMFEIIASPKLYTTVFIGLSFSSRVMVTVAVASGLAPAQAAHSSGLDESITFEKVISEKLGPPLVLSLFFP